jgi:hypothetical protein
MWHLLGKKSTLTSSKRAPVKVTGPGGIHKPPALLTKLNAEGSFHNMNWPGTKAWLGSQGKGDLLCVCRILSRTLSEANAWKGSMPRIYVQPLISLTPKSPCVSPDDIFTPFPNLIYPKKPQRMAHPCWAPSLTCSWSGSGSHQAFKATLHWWLHLK